MLSYVRSVLGRHDDHGASAVEYALLAAGVAALVVAIVYLFGGVVSKSFDNSCGRFAAGSAANASSTCQ